MSMGPPDEIDDDEIGPDDAARPTRPSDRGALRERRQDEEDPDPGTKRSPLA